MKRLMILIAMLLLLPVPADAASWLRTISVEWAYQPPIEPAVDGFQLYVGAAKVCRFEGEIVRAGTCDVLISAPTTAFTLTATFVDGTESPHSPPLDFIDTVSSPTITTIKR